MEKNLTTDSVGRQLIGFSLPYLLSYLLQTLYGMADLFIIGQYYEASRGRRPSPSARRSCTC